MPNTSPQLNVSRETMDRLNTFAELVKKWTKSINLIAPNTVADLWERHIIDSAQLFDLAPKDWKTWVDLGSGGGLPGLVIAIMMHPDQHVTLIESDTRKALFLKTVRRELDLNVTIHAHRIENAPTVQCDVLSARALAPLADLLVHTQTHLSPTGTALFPKGRRFEEELDQARKNWHFDVSTHPSVTSAESSILSLSRINPSER